MTSSSTSPSTSVAEHRAAAPEAIRCAVLTVSDTRTEETDSSGALIRRRLVEHGHEVVAYRIVPDEPEQIRALIETWASDATVQAILSNGGTGIAARDTTYDVLVGLLEKRLDGFGELFRMLSYPEIGAAAMLSRAVAGVYRGTVLFALPGSSNAVGLALEKLILPELAHVVFEIVKQQGTRGARGSQSVQG
jgi:molybdenum cofactor biosynthesis protein B